MKNEYPKLSEPITSAGQEEAIDEVWEQIAQELQDLLEEINNINSDDEGSDNEGSVNEG